MKERERTGEFKDFYPRTLNGSSQLERTKKATVEGAFIGGAGASISGYQGGPSGQTSRVPGRRYYDPTLMSSSLYLPRDFKLKNKWRRWWYTHDPVVGMVLDTHSEMAHSEAEIVCDDPAIKRTSEEMFDAMDLFTNLPLVDLEFMKIGEVTLYDLWDTSRGHFVKTVIHNPDFVEVSSSQLAPDQPVVELRPSTDLKRLVMSTNPRDLKLKKRIPKDILSRVATGRNIPLESEYTTRITRLANPYDIRGTSIVDRLFRILMYEDKLNEAQITVADNFIFPLKIFKLGDAQTGWVPDESHMIALQELLLQQHFDPNFSIIFHYGLQYESHGLEGKILRMDREWDRIDKIKMVALGISQNFLYGESTFASANAALQVLLSRYQAKRTLFEHKWIRKILRYTALQNGWYKRSKKELNGNYRVSTNDPVELNQKLIIPDLSWKKKLTSRDDQQFLSWISGIYKDGQGPISHSTMLSSAGFDLEDELRRKKNDSELEQKIGVGLIGGAGASPGGAVPKKPGPAIPGGELPPLPAEAFSKLRERIGSFFSKFRGKSSDEKTRVSAEEAKQLLTDGYNEFLKEVHEIIGYYPELKDSFSSDLFLGVPAKNKVASSLGVLVNTAESDIEFFFNTLNTQPFQNGFEKTSEFVFGPRTGEKFISSYNAITDLITSEITSSETVENVTDFIVNFKNIFTSSIKNSMFDLYSDGKFYSYKKTNYVVYKNFLRRQYDQETSLTSDGFVDIIVVEENLLLFEYILGSILNKLTEGKSLEEIQTHLISSWVALLVKILITHMFVVGILKGFEEQGFEDVVLHPLDPDILSHLKFPSRVSSISKIFSLGEGAFSELYSDPVLFDVEPVYANANLPAEFNSKISYQVKNNILKNIPFVYSDFLYSFFDKFSVRKNIIFINSVEEISDLNAQIKNSIDSNLKDPQLRMALFQKRLASISQEVIFNIGDNLYVVGSQIRGDFKQMFIKAIYPELEKLKKISKNQVNFSDYNLDKKQIELLLNSKVFSLTDDEFYKISSKKQIPVGDFKNAFFALFSLINDFGLNESFLWTKEGVFTANTSLVLDEDYLKLVLPLFLEKSEFLKKYYPVHFSSI